MNQQNQRVQMTPLGYRQLVDELEQLEKTSLPEAIERLSKARDFGDLSENAEYHSAKEALSAMEGRVEELKDILTRVTVVDVQKAGLDSVGLGSVVHIEVSHESPLGKALLGKKVGDSVEVEAPSGTISYAIKDVK